VDLGDGSEDFAQDKGVIEDLCWGFRFLEQSFCTVEPSLFDENFTHFGPDFKVGDGFDQSWGWIVLKENAFIFIVCFAVLGLEDLLVEVCF
jgi:hypothetical protein